MCRIARTERKKYLSNSYMDSLEASAGFSRVSFLLALLHP
jgi:hypothetical protein